MTLAWLRKVWFFAPVGRVMVNRLRTCDARFLKVVKREPVEEHRWEAAGPYCLRHLLGEAWYFVVHVDADGIRVGFDV